MGKQIVVGIADMKICRLDGTLITYALGSCIGICLYDPAIKLAAMIHIMLPKNMENGDKNIFKYADTAIPETLRKMAVFGSIKRRVTCKIAGGARMFDIQGGGSIGNIGQRNAEMVKQVLRAEGIRIISEDCGADYARTMLFDAATGQVKIRTFGRGEKLL